MTRVDIVLFAELMRSLIEAFFPLIVLFALCITGMLAWIFWLHSQRLRSDRLHKTLDALQKRVAQCERMVGKFEGKQR